MKTESELISEGMARLGASGKSVAQAFTAMAAAAKLAGKAAKEFQVACYPRIPDAGHPMLVQMQRIAEELAAQLQVNVEVGGIEADMAIRGALTDRSDNRLAAISRTAASHHRPPANRARHRRKFIARS